MRVCVRVWECICICKCIICACVRMFAYACVDAFAYGSVCLYGHLHLRMYMQRLCAYPYADVYCANACIYVYMQSNYKDLVP